MKKFLFKLLSIKYNVLLTSKQSTDVHNLTLNQSDKQNDNCQKSLCCPRKTKMIKQKNDYMNTDDTDYLDTCIHVTEKPPSNHSKVYQQCSENHFHYNDYQSYS
jgi:hypothetical protein